MRYALLLYAGEAEPATLAPAERDGAHGAVLEELAARGRHRVLLALGPTGSATTLRVREGRTLLCDGPVAEAREPLCGLLVIEARDLDEAIAVAGRAPEAQRGAVEIRPLREAG